MSQVVTKSYLRSLFRSFHDSVRAEMRENTRDLMTYIRERQNQLEQKINVRFDNVDQQFDEVHIKLDAIMSTEVFVTRDQLMNLTRQLKAQHIKINEAKIFSGL